MIEQNVRFEERQYFRQWWIALIIVATALPQWLIFIQQIIFGKPVGTNPAPDSMVICLLLPFGIALPLFWLMFHMDTLVTDQELIIRFSPFVDRHIPLSSIRSATAREYKPLREYGGWGIRGGFGGIRAYTVSGNRGVEIELADNKRIMIGSQRSDELAAVLHQSTKPMY